VRRRTQILILAYVIGALATYAGRMHWPNQFVPQWLRQADAQLAAVFWPLYVPWRAFDRWWIPVPAGTDTINHLDQ